jgi:hypothetical protein
MKIHGQMPPRMGGRQKSIETISLQKLGNDPFLRGHRARDTGVPGGATGETPLFFTVSWLFSLCLGNLIQKRG